MNASFSDKKIQFKIAFKGFPFQKENERQIDNIQCASIISIASEIID